jgi:hypothetical protein
MKTGYRLTIILHKTKLEKNPDGDKQYGTDYRQVSQEEVTSMTFATVATKEEGLAQFECAKSALEISKS